MVDNKKQSLSDKEDRVWQVYILGKHQHLFYVWKEKSNSNLQQSVLMKKNYNFVDYFKIHVC